MRTLVAGLLLACLVGCGGPSSPSGETHPKDTLRLVLTNNPDTLDPCTSQAVPVNDMLSQVYEGLVTWDEKNELAPGLAESWEILDGGLRYRFHLRKGVTFQNGQPFTAEDVQWSFERACDPAIKSPTVDGYLGDIVGASDCIEGKAQGVSGIKIIDDHTIDISLVARRPSFLGKLSYPVAFIIAKGSVPDGKEIVAAGAGSGTGPFSVASFTPQQEVRLKRNEKYREGTPILASLVYLVAKDPATRINLFRTGRIDMLALSAQDVEAFRQGGQYRMIEADRPSVHYIGMNGGVYEPFADVRVRRAFVMAVDRARIVRDVMRGVGTAADGVLPPAIPQKQRQKTPLGFDVAGAKALLNQAGFAKLPPLELATSDEAKDRKAICESVVGQLRENLGVDARLRILDNASVRHFATKKQLGFFYGNWQADYLDPENFLSVLLASYGQDRTNWNNKPFSDLCRQADQEMDSTKRLDLYAKAEDIFQAECPWMPVYFAQEVLVVQPWVSGERQSVFGFLPHTKTSVANGAKIAQ